MRIRSTKPEFWRSAKGEYEVSRTGSVRRAGRVLTPFIGDRAGHLRVSISIAGSVTDVYVHRLVAEAFIGPCPPGMEVRHRNGKPDDNRAVNLEYGTRSQNVMDSVRHGTYRNHNAEKPSCPRGHTYDVANTYRHPNGRRVCRACKRKAA